MKSFIPMNGLYMTDSVISFAQYSIHAFTCLCDTVDGRPERGAWISAGDKFYFRLWGRIRVRDSNVSGLILSLAALITIMIICLKLWIFYHSPPYPTPSPFSAYFTIMSVSSLLRNCHGYRPTTYNFHHFHICPHSLFPRNFQPQPHVCGDYEPHFTLSIYPQHFSSVFHFNSVALTLSTPC